jgi:hypothetical protein
MCIFGGRCADSALGAGCQFEDRSGLHWGKLGARSYSESPADCCAVCAAMEECNYFSYKARQCYYKSSMNGCTKNDYLVTSGSPPTERRTSMGVL